MEWFRTASWSSSAVSGPWLGSPECGASLRSCRRGLFRTPECLDICFGMALRFFSAPILLFASPLLAGVT
jgi:hypothetical protein